jgi:hypothetical protein
MGGVERSHFEDPEESMKKNLSVIFLDSIITRESLPMAEEVASNFYFYKKSLADKVTNPLTQHAIKSWDYKDLFSVTKGEEGIGWRLVEELLRQAQIYSELEFPKDDK